MTTGNEPAQPEIPTDQPTPGAAPTDQGQTAPAAPQEPPAPPSDDPDDVELREAQAAVQAEETGGEGDSGDDAGTGQDPAQPPQQPTAPPAQQQQPGQERPDTPYVPMGRFDVVAARAAKAEQNAAYWRGVAEARGQQPPAATPGQQQPEPPQPTPEQRLADIRTAKTELAKKYDNGEITTADWVTQQDALADQEFAVREEQFTSKVKPAAPASQGDGELYLNTLTEQLEVQHPWVQVFEQVGTEAEWEFLKLRAIEHLTQKGIDPTQGAQGRYELRKTIAELADVLGPSLVAHRARAQGIVLPGQPSPPQPGQPQPQPKPGPSPQAQARQRALEKAANAPPNVPAMTGATGEDPGAPSDARVEAMTDDEIADKLPASVRNKLLGITA